MLSSSKSVLRLPLLLEKRWWNKTILVHRPFSFPCELLVYPSFFLLTEAGVRGILLSVWFFPKTQWSGGGLWQIPEHQWQCCPNPCCMWQGSLDLDTKTFLTFQQYDPLPHPTAFWTCSKIMMFSGTLFSRCPTAKLGAQHSSVGLSKDPSCSRCLRHLGMEVEGQGHGLHHTVMSVWCNGWALRTVAVAEAR